MLLEFKNVTGQNKGFILKNITFSLEPGYLVGITGKNGAGKTTLLQYMMKHNQSYSGEILFQGKNIKENHTEFLSHIGYISEDNPFFMTFSAKENGDLLGTFYDTWDEKLFFQIAEEIKLPLNRELSALSRGEFIKFQIAFAMAHQAQLYLMDEATAGMDPVFRREFHQLLRQIASCDGSVILTSHIKSDMDRNMDYVGMIEEGNMVSYQENIQ